MKKRITALLLTFLLLVPYFPLTASAAALTGYGSTVSVMIQSGTPHEYLTVDHGGATVSLSARSWNYLTADGAELLARLAEGAMRDGLSLLDQCAAAGGTVDSAAVLNTLGLAGHLQTAALLEHILRKDVPSALALFGELYDNGRDGVTVLRELAALVRDLRANAK